jgi:cation diffusion facilitator family transporter
MSPVPSIGTMLGIGGAILLGDRWHILDPLAAVVVSIFILKVALEILTGSIRELTEESLDEEVEAEIVELASSTPGVVDPHQLRTRRLGSDIAIDLHVRVDPDMPVHEAHAIASAIEQRIRARFGESTFLSVHVEPQRADAPGTK